MNFCYYCGAPDHCQMDHYPVPSRAGGIETVPACTTCHNLKDRVPLTRWPVDLQQAAWAGLAPWMESNYQERYVDLPDYGLVVVLRDWPPPAWASIPPMSRVLYGKMRALAEDMALEATSS